MTETLLDEAQASFDAERFRESRETAERGLAERPDDVALLRIAGRASVELELDDAVDFLKKIVELQPDDARGWHDLGDALAAEGRTEEAQEAFQRAVELDPENSSALANLGHASLAVGDDREEALSNLAKAADRGPGNSSAVISLVEMYRTMGQPEEALGAAEKIAQAEPDNVLAAFDVADLNLTLGRHEPAMAAFRQLREIDDFADHEVYSFHGMIQVELDRGDLESALRLAREASAIDPHGRTAAILAFLDAEVSGPGEDPPPTREEVDDLLASSQAEHRSLHTDERVSP